MTKKTLARLIIKSYDFTSKNDFSKIITFLTTCLYHTEEKQEEEDIQSAIWYLTDKRRMCND